MSSADIQDSSTLAHVISRHSRQLYTGNNSDNHPSRSRQLPTVTKSNENESYFVGMRGTDFFISVQFFEKTQIRFGTRLVTRFGSKICDSVQIL